MDSTKRRRVEVEEVDDDASDRLGDLPDSLLHDVLSRLRPPQVVQTSVLSRRWRHIWRDVLGAVVILDEREFSGEWERFEDFADHALLSIPPEKNLDVFWLNLVSSSAKGTYSPAAFDISDRWIRRGLRRCPAAVDIRTVHGNTVCWKPHSSYFAPPAGPKPDMSAAGLCAAGFTGRMTTLCLVGVCLSGSFLEDLGRYCPVLEDLHVERCGMDRLRLIVSPTLRSFVFIEPQHPLACTHLRIAARCLHRLHLDLAYDGRGCQCVAAGLATGTELLAVAEASIRLTDTAYHGQPNVRARKKGKLDFINSMHGFLALLPNVVKLHLTGFNMTVALLGEEESQEFPLLNSLKILTLQGCDLGDNKFQALTRILQNTPALEKLGLHHCMFSDPPVKKRRGQQPSKPQISRPNIFWCGKLKTIEIRRRREDETSLACALSKISERIHPEQRQLVNTVTTIV